MKKKLYKLLIIICMVSIFLCITHYITKAMETSTDYNTNMVILDAGHGGHDPGSIYDDVSEKDINLAVTKEIGRLLQEAGIEVIYTRDEDVSLGDREKEDLQQRVKIANNTQAQFFVSIHTNASGKDAKGFEIYKKSDGVSDDLASRIQRNLRNLSYTNDRGVLSGKHLSVIRNTTMPALLIELGFIDQDDDRAYLSSDKGAQAMAKSIANGILDELRDLKEKES